MTQQRTLILGIGNTLLGDEGAGIHALNRLKLEYPNIPGVIYVDGGTLSFSLASYIEDCDRIIVFDAAELHAPPGTIRTMIGESMDAFLGAPRRSPHEVGLLDLFDIARLTGSFPEKRALIGIQPGFMGWSMEPSPAVAEALGNAVSSALGILQIWDIFDREAESSQSELRHPPIKITTTTPEGLEIERNKSIVAFRRAAG